MAHDQKQTPPVLWRPDPAFIERSNLTAFQKWLHARKGLQFSDYHAMWQWSVREPREFWEAIWNYFEVIHHSPYEEVMTDDPMPDTQWFTGSTLNYVEHIFRNHTDHQPAIFFQSERQALSAMSWDELARKVAALRLYMQRMGVRKGDRVVAFLPNVPEATIAFLAACSLGAVWSSCSPDFGIRSVLDRFRQIQPRLLIAADGYQYNGKSYDKMQVVEELAASLPTLEKVILLPYLRKAVDARRFPRSVTWEEAVAEPGGPLTFTPVPFDHPIWVLYSSGTTGDPKAITHSHGGVLLEHLKYLAFHNDVHRGERFFWFSTTGWMMWNFVQASLLVGASIVLYDGSPGYPDLHVLWRLAEEAGIHHFGTSAPFLVACMKEGLRPQIAHQLKDLRSIGSTGAPLPPEAFEWTYREVKRDLWLCSMSGGTDVCTAFVGGCPWEPVYEGEIQCRGLGCALYALDDEERPVVDEVGEMVITRPMPSMPVYFWNDPGKARYLSSYFDTFPGLWRHGDWVEVTSRHTLIIYGRSDATLNRHGVRIGTAEVYSAVNKVQEIEDSLIVNLELSGGRHYMPLFVVVREGGALTEGLKDRLRKALREEYSPRHVPDEIIAISEVPYTLSGKKVEAPVKKILMGRPVEKVANRDALKNPEALDFFIEFSKTIRGSTSR